MQARAPGFWLWQGIGMWEESSLSSGLEVASVPYQGGSRACGYPLALASIYPHPLFTPVNRSSDRKTWACLQKGQQHPWLYKWPLGWQQCGLEVWGFL